MWADAHQAKLLLVKSQPSEHGNHSARVILLCKSYEVIVALVCVSMAQPQRCVSGNHDQIL